MHKTNNRSPWLVGATNGKIRVKWRDEETLKRGYTCFTLSGAQMGSGSEYVGSFNTANANLTGYGFGNSSSASGTGFGTSTALHRHVEQAGATVTMSKTCGAGSFRAADVLARAQ